MRYILKYIIIIIIIFPSACKNKETKVSLIGEKNIDSQMIESYKEGLFQLETGDAISAAKKFNEAELLFPQSIWAPRASLMSSYSYYSQFYYDDAIRELERFFKTYPNHERENYAYYLLAMSYYERIVDEKRDLGPLLNAKKYFEIVIVNYPNSDFALDSEYKLEAIQEILASKEMYTAKYYTERDKWIPAINRYKIVIDKYETSIYVEEALHRLVELHYKLGLVEEAKKYASLLGYNYQSSKWYEQSYRVFNKDYQKISKIKKKQNKNSTLDKIKSLLK